MQALMKKPRVAKTIKIIDRVFSVVSITSVPVLISLCVYWYCERPPALVVDNPTTIEVVPGGTTHLNTYYTVSFSSGRALYSMWLEDAEGRDVYKYNERSISSPSFTFGNLNVTLPPELAPGKYSLHAELKYPLNPFKAVSITTELAKFKVVRNF